MLTLSLEHEIVDAIDYIERKFSQILNADFKLIEEPLYILNESFNFKKIVETT